MLTGVPRPCPSVVWRDRAGILTSQPVTTFIRMSEFRTWAQPPPSARRAQHNHSVSPPHHDLLAPAPVLHPRARALRRIHSRVAMHQSDRRHTIQRNRQIRQPNPHRPPLTSRPRQQHHRHRKSKISTFHSSPPFPPVPAIKKPSAFPPTAFTSFLPTWTHKATNNQDGPCPAGVPHVSPPLRDMGFPNLNRQKFPPTPTAERPTTAP